MAAFTEILSSNKKMSCERTVLHPTGSQTVSFLQACLISPRIDFRNKATQGKVLYLDYFRPYPKMVY